jgi:hypothetical protein
MKIMMMMIVIVAVKFIIDVVGWSGINESHSDLGDAV